MSKKSEEKKQERRSYHYRKTRQEVKAKIEELKKYGVELTKEEKKEIFKEASEKVKKEIRKNIIKAVFGIGVLSLGIGAGYKVNDMIKQDKMVEGVTQDKNDNSVSVDIPELDNKKEIEIKNVDNNWRVELKVDVTEKRRQEIEKSVKEDLKEKTALEYAKEIYAEALNDNDINEKSITFRRNRVSEQNPDVAFYYDTAENGDEIIRYCSPSQAERMGVRTVPGSTSLITAYVTGHENEKIVWIGYSGKYYTTYSELEEVKEYSDNTLAKVGKIVDTAISRDVSIEEENTDYLVKKRI